MQDRSGNRSRHLPLSQQLRTSWSKWTREYIPSNNRLWRRYFTRHRWRWWRRSPRYRIRRELTSQKHTSRKWSPCLGPRLRNCLWYRSPWHRLSGHQPSLMKGVRYSRTTGNTLVGLSLMKKVLIPFPLFLFILFYFISQHICVSLTLIHITVGKFLYNDLIPARRLEDAVPSLEVSDKEAFLSFI